MFFSKTVVFAVLVATIQLSSKLMVVVVAGKCSSPYPNDAVFSGGHWNGTLGIYNYTALEKCRWTITCPLHYIVGIRNLTVDVEPQNDMLHLNGREMESVIPSARRRQLYFFYQNVTVDFVSDNSFQLSGFSFQWECLRLSSFQVAGAITIRHQFKLFETPCTSAKTQEMKPYRWARGASPRILHGHNVTFAGYTAATVSLPRPPTLVFADFVHVGVANKPWELALMLECKECAAGIVPPPADGIPDCIPQDEGARRVANGGASGSDSVASSTSGSNAMVVVIIAGTTVAVVGVVVGAVMYVRRGQARDRRNATLAVAVDRVDILSSPVIGTIVLVPGEDHEEPNYDDAANDVEEVELDDVHHHQDEQTERSESETEDTQPLSASITPRSRTATSSTQGGNASQGDSPAPSSSSFVAAEERGVQSISPAALSLDHVRFGEVNLEEFDSADTSSTWDTTTASSPPSLSRRSE